MNATRLLRLLHLLAMVLFLGGIVACIVLGAAAHVREPAEFLARRRLGTAYTWAMIVPGMWGLLATGALLSWRGRRGVLRTNWVGAKQVIGLLVALNGTVFLVPLVGRILALAEVGRSLQAAPLQAREDGLGAVNLALALTALALAIWRPGAAARR